MIYLLLFLTFGLFNYTSAQINPVAPALGFTNFIEGDAKEAYNSAKEKAGEFANDAKEVLGNAAEKASDFAEDAGEKLEDLAEEAQEALEETTKKTKNFFQRLFGSK